MKGQKIMTEVKRHVEIAGYGVCLPKNTVQFKDQTRHRVVENEETQLDLAEAAIQAALENAWYQLVRLVFSRYLVRQL